MSKHVFNTTLTLELAHGGPSTDVSLEIAYSYTQGSPERWSYNPEWYDCGSPAVAEIDRVKAFLTRKDGSRLEVALPDWYLPALETDILLQDAMCEQAAEYLDGEREYADDLRAEQRAEDARMGW